MEYMYGLYEYIVRATDSELIRFFVIVAVFATPLSCFYYKLKKLERQYKAERDGKFLEREKHLMEVINANSAAIMKLTTSIDALNADIKINIAGLHRRFDRQESALANMSAGIEALNSKLG